MSMMDSLPQSGAPDDPVALLAYYDARNVLDAQLCRIFRCEAAELANVRGSEEYKDAVSEQTTARVDQAAATDDAWDALEHQALGNLQESMVAINDPKMLLGIAVQANKAGRRKGGTSPQQGAQAAGRATIDADGPQAGGQVVRLRTKFVEVLQDPHGAQRITERQASLEVENGNDLREDLTPGQVKKILRENIGVNPDEISLRQSFGPDHDVMLDFSKLAEE